jgi:aldose 1-epimerase
MGGTRRLIELRAGDARATIDADRGGRLASLRIGDRELLVGPSHDLDRAIRWGCFLMAPWPGRLADGRLRWRGQTHQLRRTHGRHAIHGLVWAAPWSIEAVDDSSATLAVDLDRDGWPFGGAVRMAYRLAPDGLSVEATILAERAMPAAVGWHPWFRRDGVGADPSLRLDASGLLGRRAMLPTGAVLPLAGRSDLRAGPPLGRRRLDDAFIGARSPAVLRGSDLEVRVEFGPDCDTVVVYTPWNAVCIEPQSAWPNALGLEDAAARRAGRRDLEPGGELRARMGITWRHPSGGARPSLTMIRR